MSKFLHVSTVLFVMLVFLQGCHTDQTSTSEGMTLGPATVVTPGTAFTPMIPMVNERTAERFEPSRVEPERARTLTSDHFFQGMPRSQASTLFVLENEGYVSGWSAEDRVPHWVAYRLFRVENPSSSRPDIDFISDDRVTPKVYHDDYTGSGYDRGHLAPSSAIGARYGKDGQLETYLTTNLSPQAPNMNQRLWEALERLESNKFAQEFGEIWVITGPIFADARLEIPSDIRVPDAHYKIIIAEQSGRYESLALIIPQHVYRARKLGDFVVSIDEIEERTGLDFCSDLSSADEAVFESKIAGNTWPLNNQLRPSFPGTPRKLNVRYDLD